MHVYIVECIAVYYIKIYTDTTRLFYVGSRGGGISCKAVYGFKAVYSLFCPALSVRAMLRSGTRGLLSRACRGRALSSARPFLPHRDSRGRSYCRVAGCCRVCRVCRVAAGLLPGCCQVGLPGCRGQGSNREWRRQGLDVQGVEYGLADVKKAFRRTPGPDKGPGARCPPVRTLYNYDDSPWPLVTRETL